MSFLPLTILAKGNRVVPNEDNHLEEPLKRALRGKKEFIVDNVAWTCCACPCGQRREFDEEGRCKACGELCRQFAFIGALEIESKFLKLA